MSLTCFCSTSTPLFKPLVGQFDLQVKCLFQHCVVAKCQSVCWCHLANKPPSCCSLCCIIWKVACPASFDVHLRYQQIQLLAEGGGSASRHSAAALEFRTANGLPAGGQLTHPQIRKCSVSLTFVRDTHTHLEQTHNSVSRQADR